MSELEELVIGNHQPILLPLLELRLSSLPKAKLVWRPTFPNTLLALKIEGCGAIDRLIKLEGEANGSGETVITIFPDLHTMVLRRLPKLKSLSDGERILNFPSLKTIKVEDCPKLTKLKLVADGLKEVECERSWWEQLNWGDERTKSFQHLYKPIEDLFCGVDLGFGNSPTTTTLSGSNISWCCGSSITAADYEEEVGCEGMEGNFGGGCGGVGDNGGPSDGRPPNPFAGPHQQCFTGTHRKAALVRHESLVRFQQPSFLVCFLCVCVCNV
ncbi:hypothetical protein ZIOFF_004042 [Zingiber officinale]|uniref:Disease resistance protein At4g27190-like leucine-rich repeats domain-containing protein n=1 Tax=Zingiber officinale TaxID=94328 RepID=A0A8J5MAZ1_ZINOF|nr:hypothetical protein ZIOFF_004042 [Zingiber officinale]